MAGPSPDQLVELNNALINFEVSHRGVDTDTDEFRKDRFFMDFRMVYNFQIQPIFEEFCSEIRRFQHGYEYTLDHKEEEVVAVMVLRIFMPDKNDYITDPVIMFRGQADNQKILVQAFNLPSADGETFNKEYGEYFLEEIRMRVVGDIVLEFVKEVFSI